MADVELLPLPEPLLVRGDIGGLYTGRECQHYARANMEPLIAENERLRAEVAELRRTLWLTVQSAGGRLWIERREAEAFDPDRSELTVEWCPENDCYLVRSSTIQEDRND